MTLTGMRKHVGVLEQAGLVTTEKVGRVRTCRLGARRLEEETAWIEQHRQLWDARFDELDNVVEELKRKEKVDGRNDRAEVALMTNRTTVERTSEREIVVTRTVDGPARLVFEAWTKPELFRQWWVPKSLGMTLLSCDMDVRVGGSYRLEFAMGDSQAAFFGTYQEVTPHSRLAWTNEEGDEGSLTTVTFAEEGGRTLLAMHELYASKEALEAAGGASDAMGESFEQLDELLVTLGASEGRSEREPAPS